MKTAEKVDYLEISLPVLVQITNDIVQRAVRAGFTDDYLKSCVVRLPKVQDENNLYYDLGFPKYPF